MKTTLNPLIQKWTAGFLFEGSMIPHEKLTRNIQCRRLPNKRDCAMTGLLYEAIDFIIKLKRDDPSARKERIQQAYVNKFIPFRARSVFTGKGYAFRFSEARTGSFSNTVLSLSALESYDAAPFIIVVVREQRVDFLMSNSTFLQKISHSSHQLRTDNIKGSFNGSDIMKTYEGIQNSSENFEQLHAVHSAFTWQENLVRLVEATNGIVGRDNKYRPTAAERKQIEMAGSRARNALNSEAFAVAENALQKKVAENVAAILQAAKIDNVNVRGNEIEQILTGGRNSHELGDIAFPLRAGRLIVDMKTKLLDRASAPKAYNIDKMLIVCAEPNSVLAFFVVGIDVSKGTINARLLPAFETSLLDATRVQFHWAGRVSRGVAQFTGKFKRALLQDYRPLVDDERAKKFLEELLAL